MAGLADVFPTETPARDHVALLVTGSTPACAGRDALVNVVDSLHENAHIPTLVLAVNPDATADETLRLTALAGGAPRYDSPSYFTPETPADLLSAFGPVPTGSAHCKYRLQAPVADPTLLEVTATPSGEGPTRLTADQYVLNDDRTVIEIVDSALCRDLNDSAPEDPSTIEFRYLSL
jgi:hypothetical protein